MKLTPERINDLPQKELDELFITFCQKGNVKGIKFLFTNDDLVLRPKINENFLNPLRCASQEGHINVLKYLLTSPDLKEKANIHLHNDYALISACEKNHLEVVKYLLTSPDLSEHSNIHAQKEGALKTAILYNNFEIAQYLITSNEFKEKANANAALIEVCYSEDIAGLEFLTSKDINPFIDIHHDNDLLFKELVRYEHTNLIKYLVMDYGIEITPTIKQLAKNANEEIQKLIESKELHETLNSELKNNLNNNNKKIKI
jgi:hypothetical protein